MPARQWTSLQYLRGAAAMMVVLHHCREQFDWVMRAAPTEVGGAGVDIFFVISGFIMVYMTAARPMTPQEFLARRFIRIAPLYWIMTAALAAIAVLGLAPLRSVTFDGLHFVQSLLFVPHENPEGRIRPLLSLGWTLNYEMFFYLTFALFLVVPQRRRMFLMPAAFLALVALGAVFPGQNPIWLTYTDPIIFEFVFGMLLAQAVVSGISVSKWVGCVLMLAGAGALAAYSTASPENSPLRWAVFGLPAAALVAGFVSIEAAGVRFAWTLPKLIGDASYSLYLTHLFTLGALRWAWTAVEAPRDPLLFTLVGAAASCAVAVLSYKIIERPASSLLSGLVPRSPRAAAGRAC